MDGAEETDLAGVLKEILDLEVGTGRIYSLKRDGKDVYVIQRLAEMGQSIGDRLESYIHNVVYSDKRHGKVVLNSRARDFFPGVREQFILDTDRGPFILHRPHDSYLNSPRAGEADEALVEQMEGLGVRTFGKWYDEHPEIKVGDQITFFKDEDRFYLNK